MKKLLYLIVCMACIQFATAKNKPATSAEVTKISTVTADEIAEDGYSVIYVPKPTQVNGGTVIIRNNSTGQQYSLSNGSAKPTNEPEKFTIPNGTYTVISISIGSCESDTPTAMSNGIQLSIGTTITYNGSGYVSFHCN
ncbi:MAG: hypothetical protein LIP05_02145 [Tannerellaceae bacterium]|nr:hypothetical protein [Tannerellaceae bacterium]